MRYKVVPPVPESLDRLEGVWQSVPLVPDAEESCCARLMEDADVPAQDTAKEWLTFCRALGLAAEGPRGYSRVRGAFDLEGLAERFRENVYAAEEALAVLDAADDPLTADAVFDRLRGRVPAWERQRSTDWTETWRERVGRILGWAVLFGLAEHDGEGYVKI